MAALNDNVTRAVLAFDGIREAIIAKGQIIPPNTPVESYAAKIQAISGSSGGLSPLANKNIGDLALIKHGSVTRLYLVIHKGLPSSDYAGWENGVALMQYELSTGRAWNGTNYNNYEGSGIHTYLNSTYYDLFDSAVKSNILSVRVPYRPGYGASTSINAGSSGLQTKVFLLSCIEVGDLATAAYRPQPEGVKLDYFLYGDDTTGTGLLARQRRIAYRDGAAADWWLRTPYTADHSGAITVKNAGSFLVQAPNLNTVSPRPVIVMNEAFGA